MERDIGQIFPKHHGQGIVDHRRQGVLHRVSDQSAGSGIAIDIIQHFDFLSDAFLYGRKTVRSFPDIS